MTLKVVGQNRATFKFGNAKKMYSTICVWEQTCECTIVAKQQNLVPL